VAEEVDFRTITAICNGCGRERVYKPDKVIETVEEFKEWIETHLELCVCGANTCDLKIPIKKTKL
jgi:secreted trypsin-like serine protease